MFLCVYVVHVYASIKAELIVTVQECDATKASCIFYRLVNIFSLHIHH